LYNVGGVANAPSVAARTGWLPSDGKWRALPVPFWSGTTANQPGVWKGYAKNMWFNPTARAYPDTQDLATDEARMCAGKFMVPWGQNIKAAY
jgi:hypothetical protein